MRMRPSAVPAAGRNVSVGVVDLRQDIVGCPVVILPHDDPAAVRQADDIGAGLIAGRRGRAGLLGNEDLRAEQRAVRVDHLRPDLEIPGAERLVSPHRHRSAAGERGDLGIGLRGRGGRVDGEFGRPRGAGIVKDASGDLAVVVPDRDEVTAAELCRAPEELAGRRCSG